MPQQPPIRSRRLRGYSAVGLLSTLEIALPLWLLIKGVDVEQWKKRVLAAA
jgi:hypothetical protein